MTSELRFVRGCHPAPNPDWTVTLSVAVMTGRLVPERFKLDPTGNQVVFTDGIFRRFIRTLPVAMIRSVQPSDDNSKGDFLGRRKRHWVAALHPRDFGVIARRDPAGAEFPVQFHV